MRNAPLRFSTIIMPSPSKLFHIYKNNAAPTANTPTKLSAFGALNDVALLAVCLVVLPLVVLLAPVPAPAVPEAAVEPVVPSTAPVPGARFLGAFLAIAM